MINFTGGMLKIGKKYIATQNIGSIVTKEETYTRDIGPDEHVKYTYVLPRSGSLTIQTRIEPSKIAEAYIKADNNNTIVDCNA